MELKAGAPFPNVAAQDLSGQKVQLEDFNQRSHVILTALGNSTPAETDSLRAQAKERQKIWDWLHAKVLFADTDAQILRGLYAVDRYGRFIAMFPINAEMWDLVEKEFIYHEAKHC